MQPRATRSAPARAAHPRLTLRGAARGAWPLSLGVLLSLAGCTQGGDNGTSSLGVIASTSIWGSTAPAGSEDSDSQAVELGVRFRSDVAGTITAIRYYKAGTNTGTHSGHLWSNAGTLLGSVTFTSEGTSGWQTATFATPIAIAANTTYVASYHTDTGHYFGTNSAFASAGVDSAPLHALEDGADGANGVYRYGASAFPTSSYLSTNYWVDVVFQPQGADAGTTDAGTTDAGTTDAGTTDAGTTDAAIDAATDGGTLTAPVAATVVHTDQTSAGATLVSGAVTTSEPARLVAFLASDSDGAGAAFSSVTGCGLTWTRVVAANGQAGPAEVWTANAAAPLSSCTVTATRGFGSWLGSITVIGYTHSGGIGASRAASAASGAPSVTLTATSAQSLVAAVGVDWSRAIAHTPAAGQTLVSQTLASVGDTYWVQSLSAPLASAGSVTIADSAPTGDMFNLAAVEILPGSAGGGSDAGVSDSGTDAGAMDSGVDAGVMDSGTDAGAMDSGTCVPSCSGRACGSDGCGGTCGACGSGLSCNASGQCVSGSAITHGLELTLADVGPAALGITTFTSVPGGTFTGTPLAGWGSLARVVGAGGETIDGFAFPQGTVVLQGASLTSEVTVNSGWLVLRGCRGSMLLNNPSGDGGGGGALYSELTAFNAGGLKDGKQPAVSILHRCYFPHTGLENVYANNTTITESWIAPDPGAPGDHTDGIQTWGGQSYLNFSRNHLQWNGSWNSTQSGLIAMYTDGSQNGYSGYDHVTVQNNYIVIGAGGGIGLHAPMGVSVTSMVVTGNRWAWSSDFSDPNYTPAVYRGTGMANYRTGGNAWSDNRWNDGPYANQFLLPDNTTSTTDF